MAAPRVVVMDNGGGLLKAGFGGDADPIAVVPNCIGKPPFSSSSSVAGGGGSWKKNSSSSSSSSNWLVGDQLQAEDMDVTGMSVRRPIERGYLINTEVQREVWERVLRCLLRVGIPHPHHHHHHHHHQEEKEKEKEKEKEMEMMEMGSLLLVEPLFNPPALQRSTDELVFEDMGFSSLCVADPPSLVHLYEASARRRRRDCSLVLDCGFSFTHAAPVFHNFTLNYAVRRMDLGGKALTNYLKELVSYRSLNVMDETLLLDHAKENLCFVSLDVPQDLLLARYHHHHRTHSIHSNCPTKTNIYLLV